MVAVHELTDVQCPICSLSGVNAEEMTRHINSAHFDAVSPAKANTGAHAMDQASTSMLHNHILHESSSSSTASVAPNYSCPICSDFTTDCSDVLSLHVDHCQHNFDENSLVDQSDIANSDSVPRMSNSDNATKNHTATKPKTESQTEVSGYNFGDKHEEIDSVFLSATAACIRRDDFSKVQLSCPVCDVPLESDSAVAVHLETSHPEYVETAAHDNDGTFPLYIHWFPKNSQLVYNLP